MLLSGPWSVVAWPAILSMASMMMTLCSHDSELVVLRTSHPTPLGALWVTQLLTNLPLAHAALLLALIPVVGPYRCPVVLLSSWSHLRCSSSNLLCTSIRSISCARLGTGMLLSQPLPPARHQHAGDAAAAGTFMKSLPHDSSSLAASSQCSELASASHK